MGFKTRLAYGPLLLMPLDMVVNRIADSLDLDAPSQRQRRLTQLLIVVAATLLNAVTASRASQLLTVFPFAANMVLHVLGFSAVVGAFILGVLRPAERSDLLATFASFGMPRCTRVVVAAIAWAVLAVLLASGGVILVVRSILVVADPLDVATALGSGALAGIQILACSLIFALPGRLLFPVVSAPKAVANAVLLTAIALLLLIQRFEYTTPVVVSRMRILNPLGALDIGYASHTVGFGLVLGAVSSIALGLYVRWERSRAVRSGAVVLKNYSLERWLLLLLIKRSPWVSAVFLLTTVTGVAFYLIVRLLSERGDADMPIIFAAAFCFVPQIFVLPAAGPYGELAGIGVGRRTYRAALVRYVGCAVGLHVLPLVLITGVAGASPSTWVIATAAMTTFVSMGLAAGAVLGRSALQMPGVLVGAATLMAATMLIGTIETMWGMIGAGSVLAAMFAASIVMLRRAYGALV